jgi:hypothetical protein
MATLDVRRLYNDGDPLFEADLDAIIDDIETFVNTTKLSDDNIQNAGITASTKLVDGSITAAKLGSDSVTTAKILDANVTTAKLVDGILSADATGRAKMADSFVNAAKIADGILSADATGRAKMADGFVNAAKLGSDAVTTVKILDLNVTRAKIDNGAINQEKKAPVPTTASSSSGSYQRLTSFGTITNHSISFTSTGRPVVLTLKPASITAAASINASAAGGELRYLIDGTSVGVFRLATGENPIGAFTLIHTPSAGTVTYQCQVKAASGTVDVEEVIFALYEL